MIAYLPSITFGTFALESDTTIGSVTIPAGTKLTDLYPNGLTVVRRGDDLQVFDGNPFSL